MANIKVKKGDTLSGIAKKFGTTVVTLKKLNNLKSADKIKAGQSINIGQASGTRTSPPNPFASFKKLDKNKKLQLVDKGFKESNGPAFSPCGNYI